ncbi:TadE/TadG family type IV pilus assembly protein [Novosphingobium olei]|nr:Tad domain-containing protein [Novosphingobium olei]
MIQVYTWTRHAASWTRQALMRLALETTGSILPLSVAAIFVLAAMAGGAVDASGVYKARNRLQYACDAGTLAGRRAITTNGYDQTAKDKASSYFLANYDFNRNQSQTPTFTTSSPDSGNSVVGTASVTVPMKVMQIFGMNNISVSVNCSATMGVGNADVVMVLDTTGSMLQTASGSTPSGTQTSKLQDLRAAMKSFYTTLATASAGTNARLRYGFVPYTQTVNVGRLIQSLNPDYLADSRTIQSRQWSSSVGSPTTTYSTASTSNSKLYSNTAYTSSGCSSAITSLPYTSWTDTGTSTSSTTNSTSGYQYLSTNTVTQPQTLNTYTCNKSGNSYYIYYTVSTRNKYTATTTTSQFTYKAVTYDTSQFKNFTPVTTQTGDAGTNITTTWDGCIVERSTTASATFSYSSLLGITPTASDLDIDTAPDPSTPSTQWAPLWKEVAYYRTNSTGSSLTSNATSFYGDSAAYGCPYQAQNLSTMTQTSFNAYADSLVAGGATYHDIGMAWGARLSSPDGIFADIVNDPPNNGGKVSRHIIFMTDGITDTGNSLDSAWGIEWHDRRVTSDGSKSQSDARHIQRFRALCDAVKAKGIRVWMIAFGTSLTTDMSYCASDQSAYTAANSTQLNAAFQDIAKQVGELRIYQ